jgi:hypothetical protein
VRHSFDENPTMIHFDAREKVVAGGAAAAALLGFFPWFQVSFAGLGPEMAQFFGAANTSANALQFTEGVLAWLAALAVVALVLADRGQVVPWSARGRRLAVAVAAGVSLLFMLAFLLRGGSFAAEGVRAGRTVWFYLALLAMGLAGWQAWARWQELDRCAAAPAAAA